MANPYYTARSESFDEFIPSHKADNAFSAHQCVDEQEQHHRIVRGSSSAQLSSPSDMDHKNRAPTRKRIQVACGRCRKRKIKCSGDDLGDGSGCASCRSAGITPCNFLRVNSSLLQATHHFPTMDYPIRGPVSSAVSSARLRERVFCSPTPRSLSYSRTQSLSNLGSLSQSACPVRVPYEHGSLNYDEDCSSPYGFESHPCMPPSSSSALLSGYCASPGGHKVWNPSGGLNRTQSAVFFSEHDGVSLGPSHTSLATDVPSLFPAISSLSSGDGSDRTLPTPIGQQAGSISSVSARNAESCGSLSSGQADTKNHHVGKSPASVLSKMPMESTAGSVSLMTTSGPTLSTRQDFLFSYGNFTSSCSPVPVNPATYNRSETLESCGSDDGSSFVSRPEPGLVGLESNGPIYGYGVSALKSKKRLDSSGTLMNGQQYFRLPQPDVLPPSSYDFMRSDAGMGYHTSAPQHGESISALNIHDY